MTDPDEDALTWEGDDRLQAPRERAPRLVDDRPSAALRSSGGGFALVVLGVLGGIALLETVFWVRGVLQLSIASTVDAGGGSAPEVAAFAANVIGRALAVIAPLVWFGAVAWRVRTPSKRLAWLALGAVLLVPWPFVLGAL